MERNDGCCWGHGLEGGSGSKSIAASNITSCRVKANCLDILIIINEADVATEVRYIFHRKLQCASKHPHLAGKIKRRMLKQNGTDPMGGIN